MRKRELPVFYTNQILMDQLNELCISIKLKREIDFKELDRLQILINCVLKEENKPYKMH